jgi:hypothetical protein
LLDSLWGSFGFQGALLSVMAVLMFFATPASADFAPCKEGEVLQRLTFEGRYVAGICHAPNVVCWVEVTETRNARGEVHSRGYDYPCALVRDAGQDALEEGTKQDTYHTDVLIPAEVYDYDPDLKPREPVSKPVTIVPARKPATEAPVAGPPKSEPAAPKKEPKKDEDGLENDRPDVIIFPGPARH